MGACLATPPTWAGLPQSPPAMTSRAPASQGIEFLLTQLQSSDAKEASAAAEQLGDYNYKDVADALLAAASQQLESSQPNTFILSKSLASLSRVAYLDQLQDMQAFSMKFSNMVAASGTGSPLDKSQHFIRKELTAALTRSSTTRATPPSLPREARPAPASTASTEKINSSLQTLDEVLEDVLKNDSSMRSVVDNIRKNLLSAVEKNLSDASINSLRKTGQVSKFQGRDDEMEQALQGLLRGDKAHLLVTGKAGVGKTTLIKMLADGWATGSLPAPGGKMPIILELSILDITNPSDPSAIKTRVAAAKLLAQITGRHVELFIDEAHVSTSMARNALKAMLTDEITEGEGVHFIWNTTSSEAKTFLADSAFSRRWTEVFVPEFSNEQAISAVKAAYLEKWRKRHTRGNVAFTDISHDAFETAVKYAKFEQPHAGNPTGLKEILEGAIIYRLRELEVKQQAGTVLSVDERNFTLEPTDLRNYLKFKKGLKLIPGDQDFDKNFAEIWEKFSKNYVGNEGLKHTYENELKSFFGTLTPKNMMARALFGPPGAGKTYLADMLSDAFFNTKPLLVSGADYSKGGLGLNKLIGSPTGTVGSEQQRSVLTKYIKDNPNGGVILIDEADLAHEDVFKLLATMITEKKFIDGLGQEWDTSRFILLLGSNVGQELMSSRQGDAHKMTWEEIETRRRGLTEKVVKDGQSFEMVRPDKVSAVMDQFLKKVALASNPQMDTAEAQQTLHKMKRRIFADYVLPPTQQELLEAAHNLVQKYVADSDKEYHVKFKISDADIARVLNVEKMRFDEGYGYVNRQLETRLFNSLNQYLNRKGETFNISLGTEAVAYGKKNLEGLTVNLRDSHGHLTTHSLGVSAPASDNPWASDSEMLARIKDFPKLMSTRIMGQNSQMAIAHELLKRKAMNWNSRIVLTKIGTTGNGKTEFFYGMADALFKSRTAAFKISNINNWGDLNNYFRSDTGFVGSHQETDFEKWFMSRKSLGGGVIILDELLSFSGLSQEAISAKVVAINKLYDMLDEGIIRFGNRSEDARGFIIGVTGNAMQELFSAIDDSPESEKLIQRVKDNITQKDIVEYFARLGFDAPKVARLGNISVEGPLSRETSQMVGVKEIRNMINEATQELSSMYDIKVDVDPEVVRQVITRVTTVKLGMRNVKAALGTVVAEPISSILFDLMGVEHIQARLVNGQIEWLADGEEVVRVHQKDLDGASNTWMLKKDVPHGGVVSTPTLKDIEIAPKVVLGNQAVHTTAHHEVFGHWMVAYLLSGKNASETISLIPEGQALGYVRPLDKGPLYEGTGLTSAIKLLAELQAGHRADFIEGFYSDGGGSNGRQGEKDRHDDLGKVEAVLDQMLSNQLLGRFTEFSHPHDKELFKTFMREVSKGMADRLIRYGRNSKLFTPIFDEVMEKRFISADRIEALLKDAHLEHLPTPDHLMAWSLAGAISKSAKSLMTNGTLSSKDAIEVERLAKSLLRRALTEAQSAQRLAGRSETKEWFDKVRTQTFADLDALSNRVQMKSASGHDQSRDERPQMSDITVMKPHAMMSEPLGSTRVRCEFSLPTAAK